MAQAAGGERLWLERIRAGVLALLGFLDDESGWARPLLLEREQLALNEASRRVHAALAEVLDAGRGQVIVGTQLTPPTSLIAELLCTAALSVIRARMLRSHAGGSLAELAPPLMEHIVEPYLGAGAEIADRISDPSLPARAPGEAKILPLRAHPRALLALRIIATAPGLSTRQVELQLRAKRQRGGELSQLLNPLEQRGLIEDTRSDAVANKARAWRLTLYGRRAVELLRDADPALRPREDAGGAARRGSSVHYTRGRKSAA